MRLVLVAAALVLAAPVLAAPPPQVTGHSWLVENGTTGEGLVSHDARRRVAIASITKLMTVLLTLEHAHLNDVVTVAPEAAEVGESSANLHAGDRLTVRELLEAALIQSANDAADALAVYVGHGSQSRFVAMMNMRARQLGLRDTHFARPDGLDAPGHYSSARDVTLMGRVLMNKPFVRQTVRMRSATIAGGRHLSTWNDLLGTFPGVIGVKTGHTGNAGCCQVAAVRGTGLTVYATILGEPTRSERNDDLAKLLRWGLSRYRVTTLIGPRRVYASARTSFGRGPVKLVAEHGVRTSVRVGRRLREEVVAPTAVALPVTRGEQFGPVRIYDRRPLIASAPLVAAKSASYPGVAARAGWYAKRVGKTIAGWIP